MDLHLDVLPTQLPACHSFEGCRIARLVDWHMNLTAKIMLLSHFVKVADRARLLRSSEIRASSPSFFIWSTESQSHRTNSEASLRMTLEHHSTQSLNLAKKSDMAMSDKDSSSMDSSLYRVSCRCRLVAAITVIPLLGCFVASLFYYR
ncbi:hypothetical protein MPSEU_000430300 [Mayamaea pseudoterrestris]|nr:hypothetical protein MPSEU_000430300 [Mayamaea pseudoterrestris]